jgi:glycosyltransferase involved in cell wall biosynthesis
MVIGIDASRAFQKNKTGIEEYSYQVIKHLREHLENEDVILYCNPAINITPDFELPGNWKIKNIRAPIFWTQIRLSLEMLLRRPDALFVPAHTVPLIHPRNTIVTIHGLEYEFCPKAYSFWQRTYMRFVIKNSCKWAKRIIAVSENTKKDLIKLYNVPENKIKVIYEGYSNDNSKLQTPNSKLNLKNTPYSILHTPYLLFVGRLEERKNICGIISAFEALKEKYNLPHKLVLAGKFGYGKEYIEYKIKNSKYTEDIVLPGYVSDEEKFELIRNADVFLFPTFYEGFGLPILEAQSLGTPVVTSNVSSMPEVAGETSSILVDPKDPLDIAEAVHGLISYEVGRNVIIENGHRNVKRFSWEKCAKEIAEIILNL